MAARKDAAHVRHFNHFWCKLRGTASGSGPCLHVFATFHLILKRDTHKSGIFVLSSEPIYHSKQFLFWLRVPLTSSPKKTCVLCHKCGKVADESNLIEVSIKNYSPDAIDCSKAVHCLQDDCTCVCAVVQDCGITLRARIYLTDPTKATNAGSVGKC